MMIPDMAEPQSFGAWRATQDAARSVLGRLNDWDRRQETDGLDELELLGRESLLRRLKSAVVALTEQNVFAASSRSAIAELNAAASELRGELARRDRQLSALREKEARLAEELEQESLRCSELRRQLSEAIEERRITNVALRLEQERSSKLERIIERRENCGH